MAPTEQITIDREIPLRHRGRGIDQRSTEAGGHAPATGIPVSTEAGRSPSARITVSTREAERGARDSLRAQIAKLEHELSGIVAGGFPHLPPTPAPAPTGGAGPHLLSLEELERLRDRLVQRVRGAQGKSQQRAGLERRSRDLLERMKEEPGRYKFVRLPVTDLGERGCGVWEVRPRLGLIGMLAGWWQLKLSSGCPLPKAARPARAASPLSSPAHSYRRTAHRPNSMAPCSRQAEASVRR
jgi:hypothetical protein